MKDEFLKRLRPTLVAIALIAITYNIIKTFFDNMENTAMLILVSITGISVLILPDILKKFWQFYAIPSTGIAIIAINLIGYNPIPLIIVISLITIITDALVINYIDASTIVFDAILSVICTFTICFFSTDLISILCLLPMYVITFAVRTSFGIKKPYKKADEKADEKAEDESESQDEKELENIDGIVYVKDDEE